MKLDLYPAFWDTNLLVAWTLGDPLLRRLAARADWVTSAGCLSEAERVLARLGRGAERPACRLVADAPPPRELAPALHRADRWVLSSAVAGAACLLSRDRGLLQAAVAYLPALRPERWAIQAGAWGA